MMANFTLQSCCICLIWLREGLGLLFWSRQKTAVGFPFMGTLLSFMLPINMIFQLVFKYSGKLTLVAIKHKFICWVFFFSRFSSLSESSSTSMLSSDMNIMPQDLSVPLGFFGSKIFVVLLMLFNFYDIAPIEAKFFTLVGVPVFTKFMNSCYMHFYISFGVEDLITLFALR